MAFEASWGLTDAKNPREEEIGRLFERAKRDGFRTHLLIVLAYNGAMRVSELIHLKISDFNFSTGMVLITPLKKAGKKRSGGRIIDKPLPKPVEYPFPPVALELTSRYIKNEHSEDSPWLFPGSCFDGCHIVKLKCPGGHISKRAVQKIFDRICFAAEIKVPGRGIHSLKHGRLTEVAKKSKDPYLVKEMGRHASVSMSDKYVKYVDLREQVKKIGGRT